MRESVVVAEGVVALVGVPVASSGRHSRTGSARSALTPSLDLALCRPSCSRRTLRGDLLRQRYTYNAVSHILVCVSALIRPTEKDAAGNRIGDSAPRKPG